MKFYIFTFGCALNKSDSERISYILSRYGFEEVNTPDEADIIIINSCAVKTPVEYKVIKLAKEYRQRGKKVIIAGCLTYNPNILDEFVKVSPYSIEKIGEAIEKSRSYVEYKKINKLRVGRISKHPVIEIIPIQEGCPYGKCTYCAGKLARRVYQSFPVEDILYWIERGLEEGKRIFYLTGMDVASYGFDLGLKLPNLLREIAKIDEEFYVRLGMANPFYLSLYIDDFLKEMANNKFFKFFHIPVQSGSNKVLRDMRRPYKVKDYIELISKIRSAFPKASIATDIIVGFPTETEEDFYRTLKLIRDVKFDVINISRYWPRPGTEAYRLKPLPGDIIKNRSRIVSLLFDRVAREINRQWLGWEGWAIVEDKGRKENSWIARNYAYKQIIVRSKENILGKKIYVKVVDYSHVDLKADIVEILDF